MDIFQSKGALWTGRILTGVMVLLFVFDGTTKLIPIQPVIDGMMQAGIPIERVRPIGLAALIPAILYAIPQTSVLGAVLLTGFLGGAMATHLRETSGIAAHTILNFLLGVLVWLGLWLRDERLRALMPWNQNWKI